MFEQDMLKKNDLVVLINNTKTNGKQKWQASYTQ